jgi:D-alanine-D-alanine ligase
MRVTVLGYLERETARKGDVVVGQVAAALRNGGHDVTVLSVHGDVLKIVHGLADPKPDLVFNLMEMFGKDLFGAIAVVGLLDLLDVPYTGGGPGEFYLQEDKGLTKKLLAFDGIGYPDYAVYPRGEPVEPVERLRPPLIVKPLRGDASIGIDARSVVQTPKEMVQRVQTIHSRWNDGAIVEEFIAGREFHVGILGNDQPTVFPPIEIDYSGMPEGSPHVLSADAKWKKDSPEYKGTRSVIADVPTDLRKVIEDAALGAYRALRVRDYGRIDLRLSAEGRPYVIEANASCYLEAESEFALAAAAGGLSYDALVNRIADVAVERLRREAATTRKKRIRRTEPEQV